MINTKLLLDTNFLMNLYSDSQKTNVIDLKENATSYFNHFKKTKKEICISSIVVAELWHGQEDVQVLYKDTEIYSFTEYHALQCAKFCSFFQEIHGRNFNTLEGRSKYEIRDDYKLLSQCFCNKLTIVTFDRALINDIKLLQANREFNISYIDANIDFDEFFTKSLPSETLTIYEQNE